MESAGLLVTQQREQTKGADLSRNALLTDTLFQRGWEKLEGVLEVKANAARSGIETYHELLITFRNPGAVTVDPRQYIVWGLVLLV